MRLMNFFNSWVMGYCGPRNDYFSPLTGVLSELAGVPLGSAEQRRATSWHVVFVRDSMKGSRCNRERRRLFYVKCRTRENWHSPGPSM